MFLFLITFSLLDAFLIYESFIGDAIIGTKWNVSSDSEFKGAWGLELRKGDFSKGMVKGLVPKTAAARHAISTKQEVTAVNDTFVLQFEHKVQASGWGCGGSYIKILNEDFSPASFNNKSPYVIMFGPDKCAGTNVVHFIYRTQNPLSQVWSEHKLKTKVSGLYDNLTHVYTLVLKADDTFELKLDNKVKASGSLHDSNMFDTPFEPPKLIPDESEKKPADWVDEEEIPDPTDFKPADWDELAPQMIPDPAAVKPADWKEDEALEIPDPSAVKPADWNEVEDGPYQPGTIDNPYCGDHGCGPWTPPEIKNPAYKGKWSAKKIPNPLYKGKWNPKDIPNPFYFTPEKTLHKVGKIYGLGFELITPSESQWFSNILVTDSVTEAETIAKEQWEAVNAAEVAEAAVIAAEAKAKAEAEAARKKEEEEKAKIPLYDKETQCEYP